MSDIETIDDMAKVVIDWYNNMLARIENYQQIPTGLQIQLGEGTVPKTMEHDMLEGFVTAMELIGMELKNNPPFTIINEDAH